MNSDIPDKILCELRLLVENDLHCNDWMTLKKYLLKTVSPNLRSLFSRRDSKTKIQRTNEFEASLIDTYERMSGIVLERRNEKEGS
jgi:hypothetical protein